MQRNLEKASSGIRLGKRFGQFSQSLIDGSEDVSLPANIFTIQVGKEDTFPDFPALDTKDHTVASSMGEITCSISTLLSSSRT